MAQKDGNDKVASMFIKGIDPKKGEVVKPKEIPSLRLKLPVRNGNKRR